MKKSLLALAVLGTFAGVASAQSTVTLFGIVDLNARAVKNGNTDRLNTLSQDGNASSRIGVRGVEDLGGGMSAGFWIEGAMQPDTGTATGQSWQRRSTVSLLGGWGELRLGRDYTPGFWNTTIFDPFGTNGVGSFLNLGINPALGNTSFVRANNTIGYFLPSNLGGLYGQVQVSAQEQAAPNGNKQQSGRIGYAAGPFNVALSYQKTELGAVDWKHGNIGGSWNFGFMNLMAQYDKQELDPTEQNTFLVGVVVPLGQGEFKFAYSKADQKGPANVFITPVGSTVTASLNSSDADQIAAGYVYNLSKRTAMYGHASRIKNKGAAFYSVPGGVTAGVPQAGRNSTGYEVGIRHSF